MKAVIWIWVTLLVFPHFSGGSAVKNLPASAEDMGLIPGLRRSPGEGNGHPLQYSCLKNTMDRGAWWATLHGVPRVGHNSVTKQQQELQPPSLFFFLPGHLDRCLCIFFFQSGVLLYFLFSNPVSLHVKLCIINIFPWERVWSVSIHPRQWHVVLAAAMGNYGEADWPTHYRAADLLTTRGPSGALIPGAQACSSCCWCLPQGLMTKGCLVWSGLFSHIARSGFYFHPIRKPSWMLLWRTATSRIRSEICSRRTQPPWTSCGRSRGS